MTQENIKTSKPSVVGIPFSSEELVMLIKTLKEAKELIGISFDTKEDLAKYDDRKSHPAFSDFYKTLVEEKLVWDEYVESVDPLINKLEKSLDYLATPHHYR